MSNSVEWAEARHVAESLDVSTREQLKAQEWTDAYGSKVTKPAALFLDSGSGLTVIEGSPDELRALGERIVALVGAL